jgi:hypothetical protein
MTCANCLRYALAWRAEVVSALELARSAPQQLALTLTAVA